MKYLLLFAMTLPAFVQVPQLSKTEQIAIQATYERAVKASDDEKAATDRKSAAVSDFKTIELDIAKNHPGFHLDEKTMQLVKDEAKKP